MVADSNMSKPRSNFEPCGSYGKGIPKYESDPVRDQIRRDENLILNAWTSTDFTKNGLIGEDFRMAIAQC